MNAPSELLTVDEVADFLRVKPSTVYEWAKTGKIPARRVGRLWRFSREEIEIWTRAGGSLAEKPSSAGPDNGIAE